MNVTVIRNHNGTGACGSRYCEGTIVLKALASFGHHVQLMDPNPGWNSVLLDADEHVVFCTQPRWRNQALRDFVLRHPTAPIHWRPGFGQLEVLEEILETATVRVMHLCLEKARRLIGTRSLAGAGLALNDLQPETVVVVTEPSAAVACWFGQAIVLGTQRTQEARVEDGCGAAFFGAFLGEFLHSHDLAMGLAMGHRYGAAIARGNWP